MPSPIQDNDISLNATTSIQSTNSVATNAVVIPSEFLCPITMEIMAHPVMTRYGHNFDRSAIVTWICSQNGSDGECPLTRKPLRLCDMIHNRNLELSINMWCQDNNYQIKQPQICSKSSLLSDSTTDDHDIEDNDDDFKHFFVSTDFNNRKKKNVAATNRRRAEPSRSQSVSALQISSSTDGNRATTDTTILSTQNHRTRDFVRKALSWSPRNNRS
jgi:U-box domain